MACENISLLEQEHLSSEVNVSTNSPKISDVTKRDVFQLNLIHKNKSIRQIYFRSDFSTA